MAPTLILSKVPDWTTGEIFNVMITACWCIVATVAAKQVSGMGMVTVAAGVNGIPSHRQGSSGHHQSIIAGPGPTPAA